MAKLLLVEDDKTLAEMVRAWLVGEKHMVEVVHDGADALERLLGSEYDLVILDWDLPSISGIEILSRYRSKGGKAPIIMLTGKTTVLDKETGFDTGADDYLTKPFHVKELSLRIKALMRRGREIAEPTLSVLDLTLDPSQAQAFKGPMQLSLLPKEFALLEFLMRHPGKFFTADALLRHVWESESDSTAEALRTCVMRLRKKIDVAGEESVIETRPKLGYRLRVD
ncbi:MAG TPA: response regulator transcription factor [Chroococcales cyanobacterium]